jgi:hypothetical protein
MKWAGAGNWTSPDMPSPARHSTMRLNAPTIDLDPARGSMIRGRVAIGPAWTDPQAGSIFSGRATAPPHTLGNSPNNSRRSFPQGTQCPALRAAR